MKRTNAKEVLAYEILFDFVFIYVCYSKVKEPKLLYYLPTAGARIVGFIHFLSVFALCEIQTASYRFELGSPCPFPTTITITP